MICYVLAMGKQHLGPHAVVGYGIKIVWSGLFITSPDHLDDLWPFQLNGWGKRIRYTEGRFSLICNFKIQMRYEIEWRRAKIIQSDDVALQRFLKSYICVGFPPASDNQSRPRIYSAPNLESGSLRTEFQSFPSRTTQHKGNILFKTSLF